MSCLQRCNPETNARPLSAAPTGADYRSASDGSRLEARCRSAPDRKAGARGNGGIDASVQECNHYLGQLLTPSNSDITILVQGRQLKTDWGVTCVVVNCGRYGKNNAPLPSPFDLCGYSRYSVSWGGRSFCREDEPPLH